MLPRPACSLPHPFPSKSRCSATASDGKCTYHACAPKDNRRTEAAGIFKFRRAGAISNCTAKSSAKQPTEEIHGDKFPDIGPCEVCSSLVDSGKHWRVIAECPNQALFYHANCWQQANEKRDAVKPLFKPLDRPSPVLDEFLTAVEVAALLKIDRSSVYRLKVPYMIIPNTTMRRYLRSDVMAWMEGKAITRPLPGATKEPQMQVRISRSRHTLLRKKGR